MSIFVKTGRQRVSAFTFLKGFFPSKLRYLVPDVSDDPAGLLDLRFDVEGRGSDTNVSFGGGSWRPATPEGP